MTATVRIPLLIFETGLQIGIDIVQFQKVRTTAVISRIVLHDRMPEKGTLLTFGQIGGVFLVQHFKSFVSMCVSTMTSEKFPTWMNSRLVICAVGRPPLTIHYKEYGTGSRSRSRRRRRRRCSDSFIFYLLLASFVVTRR